MATPPPNHPASACSSETPNISRVYDYYLGGAANFAADRKFGNQVLSVLPEAAEFARRNRQFLNRAVRFLTEEAGIRQFLDLGSGLPTVGNVHSVAHSINNEARIVYVDHDPVTIQHAVLQLDGTPRVGIIQHDLTDVDAVFYDPIVAELFDLNEPIAVLLFAVLHFLPDNSAEDTVAAYRKHMPNGSWIALSHDSNDLSTVDDAATMYDHHILDAYVRSRDQIEEFFRGFDLVPPGFVLTPRWRSEIQSKLDEDPQRALAYGGVGLLRNDA